MLEYEIGEIGSEDIGGKHRTGSAEGLMGDALDLHIQLLNHYSKKKKGRNHYRIPLRAEEIP